MTNFHQRLVQSHYEMKFKRKSTFRSIQPKFFIAKQLMNNN